MRFNVGDHIVFLTHHQYETHQVMAEVVNTYSGDIRKQKDAYVRAKVLGSQQIVTFDPAVPDTMVRHIPKHLDSIEDVLIWLSEQKTPMDEDGQLLERSQAG